jgi:hypothetical protein
VFTSSPGAQALLNAAKEAGRLDDLLDALSVGTVCTREQRALAVFNESMEYYAGLEQGGKVESWDVVLLEPHGGDLAGFVLLRGTVDQMNAVRADEEFQRLTLRADLVIDGLGIVGALMGDGLAQSMGVYQGEVSALG